MSQAAIDAVSIYIKEKNLFPPKAPLLVAASGGIDSMVTIHLLHSMNYRLAIGHCNFQLRGTEAVKDKELVEATAKALDLPIHTIEFETESYARSHGMSVQEAARELRYSWLEEIRRKNGYHRIVTGHHRKDNAETVLYKLIKRTGIRGIRGILPKRGHIVRPMLCLSKDAVLEYAGNHAVDFREDTSNFSDKYSRNFLRLNVLPKLQELNPKVIEAIDGLSHKVAEAEILMSERLKQIRSKILFEHQDTFELKFGYVLQHGSGRTILYEILRDFGFNEEQCIGIYKTLQSQPGSEFLSGTHRIIKDRKSLFIVPLESERQSILQYDKLPKQIQFNDHKIQLRAVPINKVTLRENASYAYMDLDKIQFPITIRYWKQGDYFYPFGLTRERSDKVGKKKLSKYFKDEKVSGFAKKNTPVLFSGEHLIWLVGHRIDHRFRMTTETRNVLKMKVISN